MNFTRLELHKPCTFDHWDGLDSRRGWRTIYHREGRRSARQKVAEIPLLARARELLDIETGELGMDGFCCVDCLLGNPGPYLDELSIPADSPLWNQLSVLKGMRPEW